MKLMVHNVTMNTMHKNFALHFIIIGFSNKQVYQINLGDNKSLSQQTN